MHRIPDHLVLDGGLDISHGGPDVSLEEAGDDHSHASRWESSLAISGHRSVYLKVINMKFIHKYLFKLIRSDHCM